MAKKVAGGQRWEEEKGINLFNLSSRSSIPPESIPLSSSLHTTIIVTITNNITISMRSNPYHINSLNVAFVICDHLCLHFVFITHVHVIQADFPSATWWVLHSTTLGETTLRLLQGQGWLDGCTCADIWESSETKMTFCCSAIWTRRRGRSWATQVFLQPAAKSRWDWFSNLG